MNLLPKTHKEFSQKEYWDSFFKKRGNKAFEWYGEYPELSGQLHKYIKKQDDILIVGCGNSTLSRDLFDIGYNKITNIDISQVVIKQMKTQNEKERPNLKFIQMDALNTSFNNESFSVILDKGTLDALMPDESEETINKIKKYFNEINRILKTTGRYVCISLLQEHILKLLLDYFPSNNFMFRAVRCHEAEIKAYESGENTMPVFIVVCTKFKALPRMILELNLTSNDKMQRYENIYDIIKQISHAQQAAFVCAGLKQTSLSDDEVSLDLYKPGNENCRYTIYIVDVPHESKNSQYAAFIVPQGREAEWLFSTKTGRKHLVQMTNHNRLAIITMHRGHIYESFEAVQNELSNTVCNLAPNNLNNKKIMFLSLGSDIGQRLVCYKGCSNFSGDYVIEDVVTEQGEKFRRLFYMNSQLVIQSEAKLKSVKSKKNTKAIVDTTYLTCKHHIYMSIASYLACNEKEKPSVAVIGLGGGGLCSFLNKFLPHIVITAIDIDADMLKVAKEWFGLQVSENLNVKIMDGINYLEECVKNGEILNAILFDVDSKDSTIGMSCPPKQFLENDVLNNVPKIIGKSGYFVLNVVLRDKSLRSSILKNLTSNFKRVVSYKLEEDLNEIFICTSDNMVNEDSMKNKFEVAANMLNKFFKKYNKDQSVDIDTFIGNLKLNKN